MVSIGHLPCSLSVAAGSEVVEVAAGCCCEAATSACTSASRSRFLRSRLTCGKKKWMTFRKECS